MCEEFPTSTYFKDNYNNLGPLFVVTAIFSLSCDNAALTKVTAETWECSNITVKKSDGARNTGVQINKSTAGKLYVEVKLNANHQLELSL